MNEDRAARYHRLRRRAAVASTAAGALWLVLLAGSGWTTTLAGRAGPRGLAITAAILAAALGWEACSLPFAFYRGFLLERKYGLSAEPLSTWLADHLKALAIGLAMSLAAGFAIYGAIHVLPGAWWLPASALFFAGAAVLVYATPLMLMPLFYRFRPLEREALTERLMRLSQRSGIAVLGVFEWGLGEKTTRANAALVGAGRSRRILLSDTLLKDFSEDEIEVILAHEMAHHVHHDLWTALTLETAIAAAALFAADVTIRRAGYAAADLAAFPLLVLTAGAVSLLLTPLRNAWSRHNERRADRFALSLTRQPGAFISAMRRLGAQNLAEEHPSAAALWFFHTHPSIDERIAAARRYQAI